MAVKYLSGNRLWGTDAERTGMTGTPAVRTPDFEDDFANADEWTQKPDSSPNANWNISGGTMNSKLLRDDNPSSTTYNNNFTHDLEDELGSGNTLSDTWVWRFKYELKAYSNGGGNVGFYGGITICDQPATATNFATGYYGICFSLQTGNNSGIGSTGYEYAVSYYLNQKNSQNYYSGQFTQLATGATVDQIFYVEIIRNTLELITCNLYTNSDYTGLIETKTRTIPASFANRDLRYIRVFTGGDDGSTASTLQYEIDDMKFYDDATSTDTTPSLPNGSVFITNDTNVHYMWDGTSAWNEVA